MNSAKSTKENNLTWKTTVRVKKNRVTSADLQDPPVQTQLVSRLKHFAREAQFTGDYHQAAQYYIELAVMEPSEPTHWFHIGSHFMLTKDYLKANESFLMALSIHPAHQTSLIMCGILEAMFEHHKEAETLLKQATTTESPGVIPWTVLGLLYENQNNFIQAERAFLEANSQMRQNTEDTKRQKDEECGVSVGQCLSITRWRKSTQRGAEHII
ncbi:cilia- and flagella-associated protein 70-like [Thalassophryne amazonica]|uniref:cilia- and flagella-associated protein 70-like n=1 Tax=Thalassophryne amazonica TaxID=390379 RepID=UPI00147088F8|nr:cilia- and flagella-associated protein 70-like [Thalassophryne amazonica]